ncbi:MAG: type IV pilin protein [Candidatus Zixiibacteriota bacterium]
MNKKGFTLIELMMVVLIVGIISALAIPRFQRASAQAKKREALGVLRQIAILEEAYYMEHGTYQPSTGVNEIPNINWMIPSDKRRYDYTVEPGLTGDISSSIHIVATEKHDADNDGIKHERIIRNGDGDYLGDYQYD